MNPRRRRRPATTLVLLTALGALSCGAAPLRPVAVNGVGSRPGRDALLAPRVVPSGTKLSAAALAPGGDVIALGEQSGFVLLLDPGQQRLVGRLPVHRGAVRALAFAPDRRTLYSAGEDDRVCAVDVRTGDIRRCFETSRYAFLGAVAFSRDAARVAAGALYRQRLAVWPVEGGAPLRSVEPGEQNTRGVALSPDGRHAITIGDTDGTVCDIATASPSCTQLGNALDPKLGATVAAIAFDPEGRVIASLDQRLVWLSLQGTQLRVIEVSEKLPEVKATVWDSLSFGLSHYARTRGQRFTTIAPLSGGRALALTGNHEVYAASRLGAETSSLTSADVVASTPDGQMAVTASINEEQLTVTRWDAREPIPKRAVEFTVEARSARAVATVSNEVALIGTGDHVWAVDWSTAAVAPALRVTGTIERMSRDGAFAVAIGAFRRRTPWDLRAMRQLPVLEVGMEFEAIPTPITCASAPMCQVLVAGTEMRDLATGAIRRTFPAPGYPWKIATDRPLAPISEDGRRLARTLVREHGSDGPRFALQILDAGNGAEIGRILLPTSPSAAALSRDGERLLLAHVVDDRSFESWSIFGGKSDWSVTKLRLFEVASGAEIRTLDAPDGIEAIAFSPDGARAYAGGVGRSSAIRVLDLSRGSWIRELEGHTDTITDIVVSPDGKHLVSASLDGTARIWNVATGASTALVFLGDDWLTFTDDGYFDSSRRGENLAAAFRDGRMIPLEQLAARNNRPDLLIERLGSGDAGAVEHFRQRYEERIRRLGLRAEALAGGFGAAPTARILDVKRDGKHADLTFEIAAGDGALTSYEVYANGVPLLGGRQVAGATARLRERVELTAGVNRLEVGARSTIGLESLRDGRDVSCDVPSPKNIYYFGFGVSRYQDSAIKAVEFGDEDATALEKALKRAGARGRSFTNEEVTRAAIAGTRELLREAKVDDTVILFVAGHGMHLRERGAEYVFLTYDANPARLRATAAPLGMFQELLDGIAPREKLLLIDTCESGDEVAMPPASLHRPLLPGLADGDAHDRYIYNDITRRTGAVVFSAARGYERSGEDRAQKHGFFTAAILAAVEGAADTSPKDGRVSIEELRAYVTGAVTTRNGAQHPTIDRENRSASFTLPIVPPAPSR